MPPEIDEGVITRALEVLYPEGIKENSRGSSDGDTPGKAQ